MKLNEFEKLFADKGFVTKTNPNSSQWKDIFLGSWLFGKYEPWSYQPRLLSHYGLNKLQRIKKLDETKLGPCLDNFKLIVKEKEIKRKLKQIKKDFGDENGRDLPD